MGISFTVVLPYRKGKNAENSRRKCTVPEYEIYKRAYDLIVETLTPPNLVVYLKTSVPTLMERIKERGRVYEKNIHRSYIKKLNEQYDRWMSEFKIAPVIQIDTDKYELFSLFGDMDDVRKEIETFFWCGQSKK